MGTGSGRYVRPLAGPKRWPPLGSALAGSALTGSIQIVPETVREDVCGPESGGGPESGWKAWRGEGLRPRIWLEGGL